MRASSSKRKLCAVCHKRARRKPIDSMQLRQPEPMINRLVSILFLTFITVSSAFFLSSR
jgi:hypothetical protein